jgi:hypothetical protein
VCRVRPKAEALGYLEAAARTTEKADPPLREG